MSVTQNRDSKTGEEHNSQTREVPLSSSHSFTYSAQTSQLKERDYRFKATHLKGDWWHHKKWEAVLKTAFKDKPKELEEFKQKKCLPKIPLRDPKVLLDLGVMRVSERKLTLDPYALLLLKIAHVYYSRLPETKSYFEAASNLFTLLKIDSNPDFFYQDEPRHQRLGTLHECGLDYLFMQAANVIFTPDHVRKNSTIEDRVSHKEIGDIIGAIKTLYPEIFTLINIFAYYVQFGLSAIEPIPAVLAYDSALHDFILTISKGSAGMDILNIVIDALPPNPRFTIETLNEELSDGDKTNKEDDQNQQEIEPDMIVDKGKSPLMLRSEADIFGRGKNSSPHKPSSLWKVRPGYGNLNIPGSGRSGKAAESSKRDLIEANARREKDTTMTDCQHENEEQTGDSSDFILTGVDENFVKSEILKSEGKLMSEIEKIATVQNEMFQALKRLEGGVGYYISALGATNLSETARINRTLSAAKPNSDPKPLPTLGGMSAGVLHSTHHLMQVQEPRRTQNEEALAYLQPGVLNAGNYKAAEAVLTKFLRAKGKEHMIPSVRADKLKNPMLVERLKLNFSRMLNN